MVSVEENFNGIVERLNKVFVPTFWDCKAPVVVSNALTPEGIVKDVQAVSRPKFDFTKLKNLNAEDLKFSKENIPYCILGLTAVGELAEIAAYFLTVAWYLPVVIFGCLIGFCVMKYQELNTQNENYEGVY